ncbi:MAG: hypothetical protein D6780_00205, partial [Candidatus Dadabacteria bacterium]
MSLISFPGIASGIDTASLINALIETQRQTTVVPLQNKIDNLNKTNSAFSELSSLLGKLQSAADSFRDVNGGAISKIAVSSDEQVLTASASKAASTGTYTVNVSQLAKNATFSFDDRFSSATDVINSGINDSAPAADRTVTITVGQGSSAENVSVELTSTSTAQDFVDSFNQQSSLATASLVNVGTDSSPQYAIVINSNNTGTEKGTIAVKSVGAEVAPAFQTYQIDQAKDLQFTISGISGTFTRSTNTVSDVIAGVTFNAEGVGSAQLQVQVDENATLSAAQEFVNAYNDVISFINENDQVIVDTSNGETTNLFGPLSSTSLDESVVSVLRQALSSSSTSSTVSTLSDLGITTQRDGTLALSEDTFKSALAKDPEGAGSILNNLGETLGGINGSIAQFTQFNGLIDSAINNNNSQIASLN